ncbi:MAG: hypothetical protein AAGI28_11480 [Pseudomonadota bacterium]
MFDVRTVDDLWNHIAYVRSYGPNRFPTEDFLTEDEQMTLDLGFELLRKGVKVAYPEEEWEQKRAALNQILDKSYAAYKAGEDIAAAHLLNDFEEQIFDTSG